MRHHRHVILALVQNALDAAYDEIERQARVEVERRIPRKRHRRTTVVRTKSKRGKRVRRTRAKTVKVETEAS